MISLLYPESPTTIDSMSLDVVTSETYTGDNEKTLHRVEKGADITDHVREKPDRIVIEASITNTPLDDSTPPDGGYAAGAYAKLRDLKRRGTPIVVQTAFEVFPSMILVSLSVPRTKATGDGLDFTATFESMTFVQNKTTRVVVAREPKAKPKFDAGKKPALPKPRESSLLRRGVKAAAESYVDHQRGK